MVDRKYHSLSSAALLDISHRVLTPVPILETPCEFYLLNFGLSMHVWMVCHR